MKGSQFIFILALCILTVSISHHQVIAYSIRSSDKAAQSTFFQYASWVPYCSLGFDQLLADIAWLAFVQVIGESRVPTKQDILIAYDYLDLITKLDPHFIKPYWFAAFTLGGDFHRPWMAQRLIDRGLAKQQDNWYLPYIAGINQYLFAHKETEAARYYRMAAKFPDAPKWLGRQAEILQAKIPSLVKEVNTWDTIYRNSTDPLVKERAKERLAATWMRVFKVSPSEEIRRKARKALTELDVEVR